LGERFTMSSRCSRWRRRNREQDLSCYLDDELSVAQKRRMERHLAQCPACRAELEQLRQTKALLAQAAVPLMPRPVSLPYGELLRQRQPASGTPWLTRALAASSAVVALLLIVAVSVSSLSLGRMASTYGPPMQKQGVPEEAVPEAQAAFVAEAPMAADAAEPEALLLAPPEESPVASTESTAEASAMLDADTMSAPTETMADPGGGGGGEGTRQQFAGTEEPLCDAEATAEGCAVADEPAPQASEAASEAPSSPRELLRFAVPLLAGLLVVLLGLLLWTRHRRAL
jgi:hypothetical protein